MERIVYKFIRIGQLQEKEAPSVPEALAEALADLEAAYAAPVAIARGCETVYTSRQIREQFNNRNKEIQESLRQCQTPRNGTQAPGKKM